MGKRVKQPSARALDEMQLSVQNVSLGFRQETLGESVRASANIGRHTSAAYINPSRGNRSNNPQHQQRARVAHRYGADRVEQSLGLRD